MSAVLNLCPRIGRPWLGGVYAGRYCTDHLILGPAYPEADWHTCMAWAANLRQGGFTDWQLPDIAELRVLIATFPGLFQRPRWWTRLSLSPDDAMIKLLMWDEVPPDPALEAPPDAGESTWGKHHPANAVAIRLVPLAVHP